MGAGRRVRRRGGLAGAAARVGVLAAGKHGTDRGGRPVGAGRDAEEDAEDGAAGRGSSRRGPVAPTGVFAPWSGGGDQVPGRLATRPSSPRNQRAWAQQSFGREALRVAQHQTRVLVGDRRERARRHVGILRPSRRGAGRGGRPPGGRQGPKARPRTMLLRSSSGAPSGGIRTSRQVLGCCSTGMQVGAEAGEVSARWALRGCDPPSADLRDLFSPARVISRLTSASKQAAEIAEMLIDNRPRDPGGAGHRLDRDGVEAALPEQLRSYVEELFPSILRG